MVSRLSLIAPETSPDRTAETGICIAHGRFVYSPKDSLLKKLPQRPIACPRSIPGHAISALCQNDILVILQNTAAARNPKSRPPYKA